MGAVLGDLLKVFHAGGAGCVVLEMLNVVLEVLGDLLKVFHVGGAGCVVLEMLSVVLEVLGGLLKVFHVGGAEYCARDVVCCAGGAVLCAVCMA